MIGRFQHQAREDFTRARTRAFFTHLRAILGRGSDEMLALPYVRELLRPRAEHYVGLRQVEVQRIVGSEGRYNDFSRGFLPRRDTLRARWERVDQAHYEAKNLPPVTLYQLGGAYFVRDGNHRVSVALAQGVEFIDAEVIELASHIDVQPGMTPADLRAAVLEHERSEFLREIPLHRSRDVDELRFSATGRFDDIREHIHVHKYYINQSRTDEITLLDAAVSWLDNVFVPVVAAIHDEGVLALFPRRTAADLYVWTVRHWDELKRKYGQDYGVEAAVRDYGRRRRQQAPRLQRMKAWLTARLGRRG